MAPVCIYGLMSAAGQLETSRLEMRKTFAGGLGAYREQDSDAAQGAFRGVFAYHALDDGPARVFLERISILRSSPPGADWDGIWHYQKKVGQTKPPQPVCTKDESAIISGVPAPRMTRLAS